VEGRSTSIKSSHFECGVGLHGYMLYCVASDVCVSLSETGFCIYRAAALFLVGGSGMSVFCAFLGVDEPRSRSREAQKFKSFAKF